MGLCILNKFSLKKTIVIKVFSDTLSQCHFNLRYTLADTLEANQIEEIVEEGFGEGFFQITLERKMIFSKIRKVKMLLKSIGLNEGSDYTIHTY